MGYLSDFLLLIEKDVHAPQKSPGRIIIVIKKPYSQLQEELDEIFKWQSEVDVIVDRRYGDRRVSAEPVRLERRKADRRSLKEKMVDVVIPV